MRILFSSTAATRPFRCGEWEGAVVNTSRDETIRLNSLHDVYHGVFLGTWHDAVENLLMYRIFPPHRMRSKVCTMDDRLAMNAVIIQRVTLGPIALETAVRVIELQQSPDHVRFAYATTVGHPERGIARFEVRQRGSQVEFEANAWSRSGNLLATIGRPVSRALQKFITKEAVSSFCTNSSRMMKTCDGESDVAQ